MMFTCKGSFIRMKYPTRVRIIRKLRHHESPSLLTLQEFPQFTPPCNPSPTAMTSFTDAPYIALPITRNLRNSCDDETVTSDVNYRNSTFFL